MGVGCRIRPLKMTVLLLSAPPLPNWYFFVYTLPTPLTFPWPCPGPQLVLVLSKGGCEGHTPLLVSLVTNERTSYQFPYNWQPLFFPLLLQQRLLLCAAHPSLHTMGCCSRTWFQTCKSSHSLNHWCLCCWKQMNKKLNSKVDSRLPSFIKALGTQPQRKETSFLWAYSPFLLFWMQTAPGWSKMEEKQNPDRLAPTQMGLVTNLRF